MKYLGIVLESYTINYIQTAHYHTRIQTISLFKIKSSEPNLVCLNIRQLKKLYYAFIHSHRNFGLIIRSPTPKSNLLKLQSMQSKAIRILAGALWCEHAPPLYVKLNMLSLDKLISYALAKFMHKYYLKCLPRSFNNYLLIISSIHSCHTRNAAKSNQYFIPQFSTTLLQRSLLLNLEVPNFGTVFPKILENLNTNNSF